jgi:hypothetical protein
MARTEPLHCTRLLDLSARCPPGKAYASPGRSAKATRSKAVIAMPFMFDGAKSETVVETQGIRHRGSG